MKFKDNSDNKSPIDAGGACFENQSWLPKFT
jgi:hypothetical protein